MRRRTPDMLPDMLPLLACWTVFLACLLAIGSAPLAVPKASIPLLAAILTLFFSVAPSMFSETFEETTQPARQTFTIVRTNPPTRQPTPAPAAAPVAVSTPAGQAAPHPAASTPPVAAPVSTPALASVPRVPPPPPPAVVAQPPAPSLFVGAPASMQQFQAGDPALNRGKGRSGPLVTKAGRVAWQASFRQGVRGPPGSDTLFTLAPTGFFPAEQVRFAFKLYIDESFPWGTEMSKVAGKIIGLFVGSGDADGGDYSPTGASYRLTWQINGGLAPYVYPQVRTAFSKKQEGRQIDWARLDQSPDFQSVARVSSGVHLFTPGQNVKKNIEAWDLRLHKGQWNSLEMFMRLNTPGKYDGVLGVTVNGVSKQIASVRYRYDNAKINRVLIGPFFGGSTQDYAPVRDTKLWYADFAFSRT